MSGIKNAIFGSKDKIKNVSAQVYPEWDYQKDMREDLTGTATNLLGSAGNYINQGANIVSQAANGILPESISSSLQTQAGKLYDKQVGSAANNMAFKNLGSNTMTQNALSDAAISSNDWLQNNILSALGQTAQLGSGLVSTGNTMMQPAEDLYNRWLSAQMGLSSPAQTAVQKGNSGLLGAAVNGWASGGFQMPK